MHDLVIRGGTIVDGTGRERFARRHRRRRRRADAGRRRRGERSPGDRRGRRRRDARLRRRAHALRRTGDLGFAGVLVLLARGHDGRHGQLRRRLRAGAAGSKALVHRADGGGRGHPCGGARRGALLGLADVSGVSRRDRPDAPGDRRRGDADPLAAAGLRDGRARGRSRGGSDGRRARADASPRPRGRPGRCDRRLDGADPEPPNGRGQPGSLLWRTHRRARSHRARPRPGGRRIPRAGRRLRGRRRRARVRGLPRHRRAHRLRALDPAAPESGGPAHLAIDPAADRRRRPRRCPDDRADRDPPGRRALRPAGLDESLRGHCDRAHAHGPLRGRAARAPCESGGLRSDPARVGGHGFRRPRAPLPDGDPRRLLPRPGEVGRGPRRGKGREPAPIHPRLPARRPADRTPLHARPQLDLRRRLGRRRPARLPRRQARPGRRRRPLHPDLRRVRADDAPQLLGPRSAPGPDDGDRGPREAPDPRHRAPAPVSTIAASCDLASRPIST